ncbi:MAG: futalosine hydrolase [Chitinophagaceae bacterium]
MYILLVAATAMEIRDTVGYLIRHEYKLKHHELAVLTSGVGPVLTTYSLVSAIRHRRPDYIIQAGIAGSFSSELLPGKTVIIQEEIFGDIGVLENGDFKDAFDLRLAEPSAHPFTDRRLVNPYITDWLKYRIPVANGITVNEITTSPARINLLKQKYNVQTESMEGAAFHYVCLSEMIPFIQFRSISNLVGERNKNNWKLSEAVQVLNNNLINILHQLSNA